jgi:hypothetical protein
MDAMEERFWGKVDTSGKCWLWTASLDGHGYGKFYVAPRVQSAHRVAYMIHHGEIPKGLMVLHRCDTPRCVRPSHLFLGTATDNSHDMMSKGRSHQASKTHCAQGHEFTEKNTYQRPDRPGSRTCRECNRIASLKYYPKRKGG